MPGRTIYCNQVRHVGVLDRVVQPRLGAGVRQRATASFLSRILRIELAAPLLALLDQLVDLFAPLFRAPLRDLVEQNAGGGLVLRQRPSG